MTNNDSDAVTKDDAITFDPKSGISEDEQKEILEKIDGITESRRRSLSATADAGEAAEVGGGKGKKNRFKAKKSGNLFPALVNAAAVIALVGGLFVLSSFQGKTDTQVRTGTKVYNSAERALIAEIRKETSSRLEAKENEIAQITTQLEGVDAELRGLYSSSGELTDEQRVTEARLKSLHEEYLASLAILQDERSRILEDARTREAVLQTQLENRTRELALTEEQSTAALELVRSELDRLSKEQAQAATVEARMGALFANLYGQLNENRLDEAAGTIQSMRNFLNTPAFQALRSIQARRELYTQSVNAFQAMLDEARRNRAIIAGEMKPPDASAEEELADLRERVVELQQNLDAVSQGSGATRNRLAELDKNNKALEASSKAKDRTISDLESKLTMQTRDTQTARQQTETVRQQAETARQQAETARQEATAAHQTEVAALTQTVEARETTIKEREDTIRERDSTINEQVGQLRTRNNVISVITDVVGNDDVADMSHRQISDMIERIRRTLNM
jgi:chromosome segregation ATPase